MAFATFSVRAGISLLTICAETPQDVYTAFGNTITTGTEVFSNTSLTIPFIGADFIVNVAVGDIFEIGSGNGIIGAFNSAC